MKNNFVYRLHSISDWVGMRALSSYGSLDLL